MNVRLFLLSALPAVIKINIWFFKEYEYSSLDMSLNQQKSLQNCEDQPK